MSGLETIWAGWRSAYLEGAQGHTLGGTDGRTLFEALASSDEPDEQTLIVWRGQTCYSVLNLFPYCSGHLLVLPKRAVRQLHDLDPDEASELWCAVTAAVKAIQQAYEPEGVNVGLNLGKAAGAGIPEHLHFHCLPRWAGDTNFMTTVASARVMPEDLTQSWRKLRQAWPQDFLGA